MTAVALRGVVIVDVLFPGLQASGPANAAPSWSRTLGSGRWCSNEVNNTSPVVPCPVGWVGSGQAAGVDVPAGEFGGGAGFPTTGAGVQQHHPVGVQRPVQRQQGLSGRR